MEQRGFGSGLLDIENVRFGPMGYLAWARKCALRRHWYVQRLCTVEVPQYVS